MTRALVFVLIGVLIGFAFLAPPARAQAGSDESDPSGGEAQPQAVRITTFVLQHPGVPDQAVVPVMRALDDGLKRNPRLEMKDLDTRLADFAQEMPQDQIDEGRLLLQDGHKALTSLALGVAIKKLSLAVDALSKVLPYIKKQELADAMMALAAAQFEEGDRKGSRVTLIRLFTWRPDFRLDTNKYPPSMITPVDEAKREVEKAKRGSLEIRSEPHAAQAYVDGKYVGVTPTFAEGLAAGEHWVTLKKEGYRKAVTAATVSPKVQQVTTILLERSGKYLLVEQALKGVEAKLGAPLLDASVDNLKEVLFIDHAVFVRPTQATGSAVQVDAYLYDLRTRRRLTHVARTVPVSEAEKRMQSLASTLYMNVNYDAELETPKDAPPPERAMRRSFYKTWWFWTVTGMIVAGVAVGAAFAPQTKDCGPNFCPGFSF